MSERFAAKAAGLAGLAGVLLGWRPDEFWRATPEELGAVLATLRGDEAACEPVDGAALRRLQEMFLDG
jgi:uncharacterized phage protein (TIGR02216 family)